MNYHTRKWIKPEDLNPNHSLFGGRLLQWIDEEAALYAIIQLENSRAVTKYISEINFVSSAKQGDIIEIGIDPSIKERYTKLHAMINENKKSLERFCKNFCKK